MTKACCKGKNDYTGGTRRVHQFGVITHRTYLEKKQKKKSKS